MDPVLARSRVPPNLRLRPRTCGGVLTVVLVVAAALAAVDLWRPVDGRIRETWREPDVAGIARNFDLEGMNILYPRIDWRGDGPGFVESEFPLYPWTIACLYRVFGYHEEIGRVVSYLLSLATLLYLAALARLLLPRLPALVAVAFVAINPLWVRLATGIQPEALMHLCYVGGVYHFLKWCRGRSGAHYWLSLALVTLAILVKLPALHVGIVLALLTLHYVGLRAFRLRRIWLFAGVALVLPGAWYWHARQLWLTYGNSLGLSNEALLRITSGSFLHQWKGMLLGNVSIEVSLVWTLPGLALGALGAAWAWRARRRWVLLYWLAALLALYVVAGRTTGEAWAAYYHVVSLAPAGLLVGGGLSLALNGHLSPRVRRGVVVGVTACLALAAAADLRRVASDFGPTKGTALFGCARAFQPLIEPGSLIVASAPAPRDQFGLGRAYNAPYLFFWTRTKGFSLPDDQQTGERLEELRRRGAAYFLAERRSLARSPGFEGALRNRYTVLADCGAAVLFGLGSPSGAPRGPTP